jgi:hypothetical protein
MQAIANELNTLHGLVASLAALFPAPAAPTLTATDTNAGNVRLGVPSGTTIDQVKVDVTPAATT